MRSLLIAPADEQRLAEALESGADAIIVDLAGAAPATRDAAARFLKETRRQGGGPALRPGGPRGARARPSAYRSPGPR